VNVSLPNLSAIAMPAKTSPVAAPISTKFSATLAEAQSATDASMPGAMSAGDKQNPKKASVKNEKSETKSSDSQASSALAKATAEIVPAAPENKAPLTGNLSFGSIVSALKGDADESDAQSHTQLDTLSIAKSDSDLTAALPSLLATTDSGVLAVPETGTKDASSAPLLFVPVPSNQAGAEKTDLSNSAADNQQSAVSATNLLGTWTARSEDANFTTLVIPPAANMEAPAAANGKPASGTKTVPGDTSRGVNSTLENKTQAGFTLQSHTASSTAPASDRPDVSNGQQEKETTSAPASAEAKKFEMHKKDIDGAGEQSPLSSKMSSSVPGTTAAGNGGAQSGITGTATAPDSPTIPGAAVSMQASTTGAVNQPAAGTVTAASREPSHIPSTVGAEDMEPVAEAASLAATSTLHAAKLVAGLEQSELRVGLRGGEFGSVDIRTSLVRNQFTAEISVERGELGRALVAELPSLQHRLTEQHLPAADITVQHESSNNASEFQQGSRQDQSMATTAGVSSDSAQEDSTLPLMPVEVMETTTRLDIHM
jgi:flagellar hook-length control protein FliK